MTKKRSKIAYRDLLAPKPPASEAPPPAPPAPAPKATPPKRARKPARAAAPEAVSPLAEGAPRVDAAPSAAAEAPAALPAEYIPDPVVVAAAIAERIASIRADDDAPRPDGDADGEEEPAGPLPPLRERVRQRVGVAQLLLFRVGSEWFATDLAAAEEAIELPQVHHVPEMPDSMLGMFDLRGHMLPIYAPTRTLGVALRSGSAATIVLRGLDQRVGIAVDDVEDVFSLDLAQLRDLPGSDDADGVVLGVARHGNDLVAVLDAEALVAACLSDRVMESV